MSHAFGSSVNPDTGFQTMHDDSIHPRANIPGQTSRGIFRKGRAFLSVNRIGMIRDGPSWRVVEEKVIACYTLSVGTQVFGCEVLGRSTTGSITRSFCT